MKKRVIVDVALTLFMVMAFLGIILLIYSVYTTLKIFIDVYNNVPAIEESEYQNIVHGKYFGLSIRNSSKFCLPIEGERDTHKDRKSKSLRFYDILRINSNNIRS